MPQEIEIPLDLEEQKPLEEPSEVKKTPEIYECDGDYMVFDSSLSRIATASVIVLPNSL